MELSSLLPLLFEILILLHWFIVTQIINIIVQSALVHRAINFSYEELLGFLLSNILLFTVGVLLFEHVFNSFDNILLRDLLKTLSIWLFILLKLVLFDRSKLLDIRNISLNLEFQEIDMEQYRHIYLIIVRQICIFSLLYFGFLDGAGMAFKFLFMPYILYLMLSRKKKMYQG